MTVPPPPLPDLAGPWSIRPARNADVALVHDWMLRPHVATFWQQAWPLDRWDKEITGQLAGDHSLPCLIDRDGQPVAYTEIYRVARDRLATHYEHHPHDLGVHIAIGEPSATGRGLGRVLLRALADGLLAADPVCPRVVAEPDVHNAPSVRAFTAAGFHPAGEITLPEKTATLLIRPRDDTRPPSPVVSRPSP